MCWYGGHCRNRRSNALKEKVISFLCRDRFSENHDNDNSDMNMNFSVVAEEGQMMADAKACIKQALESGRLFPAAAALLFDELSLAVVDLGDALVDWLRELSFNEFRLAFIEGNNTSSHGVGWYVCMVTDAIPLSCIRIYAALYNYSYFFFISVQLNFEGKWNAI